MRVLPLFVVCAAAMLGGTAYAQNPSPPASVSKDAADPLTFEWINATTMTDGSPIEGVTQTAIFWTPRAPDDSCGAWAGEVFAAWPATTLTLGSASIIGDGQWCIFAYHDHLNGGSEWSNAVFLDISGGVIEPGPDPEPNPFLTLVTPSVYGFSKVLNGLAFDVAGAAPVGTQCLDQTVGEYHVVPRDAVETWYGRIPNQPFNEPLVVVGECL